MSIRQVQEFHQKFALPMGDEDVISKDNGIQDFRIKFLEEELQEFKSAIYEGRKVDAFDALLDLVYVAQGTALFMGLSPAQWDEGMAAVQKANMAKERAASSIDNRSKRKSALDVVKPAGWTGPESSLKHIVQFKDLVDKSFEDEFSKLSSEKESEMSSREAVFSFATWLTQNSDQPIIDIGRKCQTFCDTNHFAKFSSIQDPVSAIYPKDCVKPLGTHDVSQVPSKILLETLAERGGHPGAVAAATLLCVRKSEDYNHGQSTDPHKIDRSEYFPFGVASYAHMVHTKSQRFVSLAKKTAAGGDANFEGLEDTALDIINYAGFYVASLETKP